MLILAGMASDLLLSGCAGWEATHPRVPVRLTVWQTFKLPVTPAKIVADSRSDYLFILDKDRPYVHILRNGIKINSLGGFGMDKTNFLKLSDIALDNDGNLLTLDSFTKQISKFTPAGMWVADISLSNLTQPEKLAVTSEGDLLVFDAAPREIARISAFDRRVTYSFGRFNLGHVSELQCSRDFIVAINDTRDKSVVFSALGQFLREEPMPVIFDMYQNEYVYTEGALRLKGSELKYPFGKPAGELLLSTDGERLLVSDGYQLWMLQPVFEER